MPAQQDGGGEADGGGAPDGGGGGSNCGEDADCLEGDACDLRSGRCVTPVDRCAGVPCGEDERCRDGRCVQACEEDPCAALRCAEGHHCDPARGRCVLDELCAAVSCTEGTVCEPSSGACVPGAPPADGAVGAPCRDEGQCLRAGVQALCLPSRFTGFPGGYCTSDCGRGVPCPGGSSCLRIAGSSFCGDQCRGDADCREQYRCGEVPGVAERICLPPDLSRCDAAVLGDTECQRDEQCREGGICDREAGRCACSPPGGPCGATDDCEPGLTCASSLPGGFCTRLGCDLEAPTAGSCPEQMACLPLGELGACVSLCEPRGGEPGCRSGYNCLPVLGAGLCVPRECGGDADCRARCTCATAEEACGPGGRCGDDGFCLGPPCSAQTEVADCGGHGRCGPDGRCARPSCDVPAGRCDPRCASDEDCGFGRRCEPESGRCFIPCAAFDDQSCGERGVCDASTGRCAPRCDGDADCGAGDACDPALLRCVPRCAADADCEASGRREHLCLSDRGVCAKRCEPGVGDGCLGESRCYGSPSLCRPPCQGDGECGQGEYCDEHTGRCRGPCEADDDCGSEVGFTCHPTGRCAPPCDFDFQCRSRNAERCDRRRGQCVPPGFP